MEPVVRKGDMAQAGRKKLDDFRRKKAEAAAKAKGKGSNSAKGSSSQEHTPSSGTTPAPEPAGVSEAPKPGQGTQANVEKVTVSADVATSGAKSNGSLKEGAPSKYDLRHSNEQAEEGSLGAVVKGEITASNRTSSNGSSGPKHMGPDQSSTQYGALQGPVESLTSTHSGVKSAANGATRPSQDVVMAAESGQEADRGPVRVNHSANALGLGGTGEDSASRRMGSSKPTHADSKRPSEPSAQDESEKQPLEEEHAASTAASNQRESTSTPASGSQPAPRTFAPHPSSSSANGTVDRGGSSSVASSPSPAPNNAPPKATAQSETPAAIPLLSPSLPSPSPSPQHSLSSEGPSRSGGNRTPVTLLTNHALNPVRARLAPSPPRTVPPAATFRPPQRDQEASRPDERISVVLRPAAAAATTGEAETSDTGGAAIGASRVNPRSIGTGGTGVANSTVLSTSGRPNVSKLTGPQPTQVDSSAPPIRSVVNEEGSANRGPILETESERLQSREPAQEVSLTPGDANRGEGEPLERFGARLGAIGDTPQMVSTRRRLDYVFAEEGEPRAPDATDPRVARVQSQPSFKDFVPDDPAPQPAHRRSQTPDSIASLGPTPVGLVQTASTLRSSLANLFAPSARPVVQFPRPDAGGNRKLLGEGTLPGESAGNAPGVVLSGTRSSVSQPSVPPVLPAPTASRFQPSEPQPPGPQPSDPQPSDPQPSNPQPSVLQPPPATLPSTAPTANSARYPRSPFVPVTSQSAGSQPTEPAPLVSTQPSRAVLKLGSVNGDKPSTRKGGADKPAGPPLWSRSKPQTAAIDLNPSAPDVQSFTFPSSVGMSLLDRQSERQPVRSERPLSQPEQPSSHSERLVLRSEVTSSELQKSPSRPGRGSRPLNGGLQAPTPAYHSPPLSPRPRPPTAPVEESGVVVGPRKSPALSPRRRPRSPKPEPLPSASIPSLTIGSPPPLRPVSTHRAPTHERRSSGSSVESANGNEKPGASTRLSQNGLFARATNSTDGLDVDAPSADSQPSGTEIAVVKAAPKPAAKRSLLQSALAPPQNPKPLFRSSFTQNADSGAAPARSSFTLPTAGLGLASAAGVNRSPRSENGSGRLSRLPSMPAVEEAGPSPGRDGGDFASLEQHIQDLTQEKFALQRGVETARVLAASLEEENSRLTEDFNRQAQAVQSLKSELERQQAAIKAQQLVAEAMSEERDRLQRENAGALEQAQVMGREVVHLEEQVMRLRSSELKLRQELEGRQSGYDSARRQLTTMAADRNSLRQMMDALQEERRLLVAKLRQLGVKNALEDVRTQVRTGTVLLERSDATTSTDDLPGPSTDALTSTTQTGPQFELPLAREIRTGSTVGSLAGPDRGSSSQPRFQVETDSSVRHPPGSNAERVAAAVAAAVRAAQNSPTTSRLGRSASGAAGSLPLPTGLPEDQARVIENVNRLMDEIAAERRAMAAALRAETGACEELRVSNSELSRKLALLTEQLRASDGGERDGPSSTAGTGPEISRVDEGDEVVERVLGWISNFFAGR